MLTVLLLADILHNLPQIVGVSMTSYSKKVLLSPVVIILAIITLAVVGYGLMTMTSQLERHSQPLTAIASSPIIEAITIDDVRLPPQVHNQVLSVGREDDTGYEQRVVVSEQQIDAMIDEQHLKGHHIAARMTDTENVPVAATITPEVKVAAITEIQLLSPVAPTAVTNLDLSIKLGTDKKQLVAVKPTHYALQLAATPGLAAAVKFITIHNMAEMTMIYQTERNQQPWFIVVTGNYATADQARAAQKLLSSSLQQLKPWLKSYRQIQQEMNRLK